MENNPLLIILGATASGKTRLAIELAKTLHTAVISADSRQIFKGMDIGTGKDLTEFAEAQVPFYLIDTLEAGEHYNVNAFKEDFYQAYQILLSQNKLPILCGGTGMYIHSLLQNHELTAVPSNEQLRSTLQSLDKSQLIQKLQEYPDRLTAHADLSSSKRLIRAIEIASYLQTNTLQKISAPVMNPLVIGLLDDVETRREKIRIRLIKRLKEGLIEEVKSLIAKGVSAEKLIFYGLEYKFVTLYLLNEIDYQTLLERLNIAICQFAKRQMTFFRKMEKDGVKIHWLKADSEFINLKQEALKLIDHQFQIK